MKRVCKAIEQKGQHGKQIKRVLLRGGKLLSKCLYMHYEGKKRAMNASGRRAAKEYCRGARTALEANLECTTLR